ncbi:MAG TPA: hypothetical protein VFX42_06265 [Gemmatimonadales bacterium]|nr:hypothetical protein [Gemmatimonadales bacterium]
MRSSPGFRLTTLSRFAIAALSALVLATPASAQFGGLQKKIKKATGQEDSKTEAAASNANTAAPAQGGTIVLTSDVVTQLLTGLKAGQAERDAAAKEDTPYGRYTRAKKAYAEAKPKCEAAQATFPQRAAANQKMNDKYSALTQKMVDAMQKQDQKLAAIYQDSAMAMMDPSCVVKQPEQPKDFYDAEREVEVRAEKAEVKASGWSAGELAMVKERADAILRDATAADVSASEKSAVAAKSAELKPLMGIQVEPAQRAQKTEPAGASAPVPAAATTPAPDPQATAAANKMGACMAKNMEAHKSELESLQKQAEAAQKAGDQSKLMAIAQRLQEIQMAGCTGQ